MVTMESGVVLCCWCIHRVEVWEMTAPEPEVKRYNVERTGVGQAIWDAVGKGFLTTERTAELLNELATRCAAAGTLAKENAGIVSGLSAMLHNTKADLTAARAQVAAMEAWLRNGHDADFSDRWICAPEGANGPVIARGYKFDDITAPTLAELAAALPTPTPQPEQDDA